MMVLLCCCKKRNIESSVIVASEREERRQVVLSRSFNNNNNNEESTYNDRQRKNNDQQQRKTKPRRQPKAGGGHKKSKNIASSTTNNGNPILPDSREEKTTTEDDDINDALWMEDVWLGRINSRTATTPNGGGVYQNRRHHPPTKEAAPKQQQQPKPRRKRNGGRRIDHQEDAEIHLIPRNNTTDSPTKQPTTTKPTKTTKKKNKGGAATASKSLLSLTQDCVPSSSPKNDKTRTVKLSKSSIPIIISPTRSIGNIKRNGGHHVGGNSRSTTFYNNNNRSLSPMNNDKLKIISSNDDALMGRTVIEPPTSILQQQQPEPRSSTLWEEVFEEQQSMYRRQSELNNTQYHYQQHQQQYPSNNNRSSHSILLLPGQQQQKSQLSKSIVSTFQELSKERPDQMEEEAIQRAMELSMLDVALVYCDNTKNSNNNNKKQKQSSSSATGGGSSKSSNALTISSKQHSTKGGNQPSPYKILGISPNNATPDIIKAAYRKLARMHHPDKGGDSNKFQIIACAYRSLLSGKAHDNNNDDDDNGSKVKHNLKGTAHWDKQLQDHRKLVQELFQANGINIEGLLDKQRTVLEMLAITNYDVGSTNRNEQNELIRNSCFYLSLATSYLWGIGAICYDNNPSICCDGNIDQSKTTFGSSNDDANNNIINEEDMLLVGETALQLKRTIEAAVVKAHPEWAVQGMVGEEVQAFSDFLVYTLDSQTLLSDWAVIIFDACSGYCDVYKGRNYHNKKTKKKKYGDGGGRSSFSSLTTTTTKDDETEKWAQTNTITLRYIPGHYQPLIPSNIDAQRPSLETILSSLDDAGVFYVVTDGNS